MSQPAPLKVKQISVDELHPAPWNANRVPEDVLEKVRRSITDFGVVENLVARARPDGGYEVISGNHRLGIYREMGITKAPVHVVDVDDAHARILAQTLNRTRGQDDAEAYAALLTDVLADMDMVDVLAYLPESEKSLTQALDVLTPPAPEDADAVPDLPDKPESKPGEVYELGPHRLVCGDSTDADVLELLMAGEKADVLLTDPPYGVSYGGGRGAGEVSKSKKPVVKRVAFGEIANDDLRGEDLQRLLVDALGLARANSKSGAAAYVWFSWKTYVDFLAALKQIGVEPSACIVWDKGSIGLGHADYRPQHEFCFYFKGNWTGDKAQSDVWTLGRDASTSYAHPTQKPVALLERAVANSCKRGGLVLDVFGGSGTTLLAADRIGRTARLVELDPRYCDVIRKRWEDSRG
jgi:DNA modification methylase